MGWNSTLVIMNDGLHVIKDDKDFGTKVYNAVNQLNISKIPIDAGPYARAIEQHRADGTALIAVGGNTGVSLGEFYPYGSEAFEVRMLKALADKLGYRVSKKPKRSYKVNSDYVDSDDCA